MLLDLVSYRELSQTADPSPPDAQAQAAIDAVCSAAVRLLGPLERAEYEAVYVDAPPGFSLRVPGSGPLVAADLTVEESPRSYGNPAATWTALEPFVDYFIDADPLDSTVSTSRILRRINRWWGQGQFERPYLSLSNRGPTVDPKAIRLSFSSGYNPVPADLQAGLAMATTLYLKAIPEGRFVTSESWNGYSKSADGQALAEGILKSPAVWHSYLRAFHPTAGVSIN